jgi:hypothetical protein
MQVVNDNVARWKVESIHTSQTPTDQSSPRRLMLPVWNKNCPELLISQEFHRRIREDPQQRRRMTAKEASGAILIIDDVHGAHDAKGVIGIAVELGV